MEWIKTSLCAAGVACTHTPLPSPTEPAKLTSEVCIAMNGCELDGVPGLILCDLANQRASAIPMIFLVLVLSAWQGVCSNCQSSTIHRIWFFNKNTHKQKLRYFLVMNSQDNCAKCCKTCLHDQTKDRERKLIELCAATESGFKLVSP